MGALDYAHFMHQNHLRLLGCSAVVCAVLAAPACEHKERSNAPAGAAASASGAADTSAEAALSKAERAAKQLGGAVRSRLVDAMNTGGPSKAVEVCSREAQGIAANVREETGVSVGRSSLRLRNEADAPPAWVGEWLKAQGERKAEGVAGVRAIEKTPSGSVARVIKPIAIEATCLTCHGDPASIQEDIKNILKERYPKDQATGYQLGDLRGALWAEVPVAGAP